MRVVELFAGAGGMSLGLTQAGLDVRLAYDWSMPARRVYAANIKHKGWRTGAFVADVGRFPQLVESILEQKPNLIAGGPPCQDFSAAGKMIEGSRAQLTGYYAQLISVVKPEWFILENVERAIHAEQYKTAKDTLRRAGYGFSENVLIASRYGTPQNRKRLFLIGRLGEQDGFLDGALLAAASPEPMTIRDAVGDRFENGIYLYPRHTYKKRLWSVDEPSATIRSSSSRPYSEDYVPVEGDAEFEGRPYEPFLEDFATLQGFPDDWDWGDEHPEDIMLMIANAVPPPLARAVGKCILDRHEGRSLPAIAEGFGEWLKKQGYTGPSVRNIKSRVNAGRRLLGGRTFSSTPLEIGMLETTSEFDCLAVRAKSDIRSSLRMHREYLQHLVEAAALAEAKRTERKARRRAKLIAPLSEELETQRARYRPFIGRSQRLADVDIESYLETVDDGHSEEETA
ncbi:DNA cytosine methyltransferase [Rhizobium leguminosarum]|uniref:DNA cytosine methyltransferase n=1 Tax=Rhizobium leguminosarum TaxID=384 RepID=UPI001C9433C2|nr:DNA (cytosine-5-)-methyltransferase [Rhizobium leguminosarum]MBY5318203.1 DNA (cytosine-5-)-methyltransferase [Rhizobium leguminosarum]